MFCCVCGTAGGAVLPVLVVVQRTLSARDFVLLRQVSGTSSRSSISDKK